MLDLLTLSSSADLAVRKGLQGRTEGSVGRGTGEAQNGGRKEAAPSRPYAAPWRVGLILA